MKSFKKKYLLIISIILVGLFFVDFTPDDALGQLRVITPPQGGTGTGIPPTKGQVLVGQTDGTYLAVATSTLGISATGDGVSNWINNGSLTPSSTVGIRVFSSSTITDLSVTNGTTTALTASTIKALSSAGLIFYSNNGTQVADFGAGGGANATFSNGVNVTGALGVTGLMSFVNATGTSMTLNGNAWLTAVSVTGNVGIGTTSPTSRLHIGNNTDTPTSTPLSISLGGTYTSTGGTVPKLRLYESGNNILGIGVSTGSLDLISGITNGVISFYTNGLGGTPKMVLNSSGSLGVGTTTPSRRLTVQGGDVYIGGNFTATGTANITGLTTMVYASTTGISGTNLDYANATGTTLAVTGTFNFLGDIITNVLTWFDSEIESLTSVILQGVWDFGGVTSLEIPNGASPTVDAIGEVALDTTDNQFIIATSTTANAPAVFRSTEELYQFSIPSTSPAFATGTLKYLPKKSDGYIVTEVWCGVEGGTNKIINIFGSNLTCTTGNGASTTAPSINTVGAGSTTVGLTASTTSGVVNWLNVTIIGRWVRE
jgi:hypothetical protein